MTQHRKSSIGIGYRKPFRAQTRFLVAAISGCFVSGAIADPATFTVVNGTAVAQQAGKVLTITNSAGAILNWNKFGVAVGDTTHFQQTSSSSAVLNRVLSGAPISEIYGTLSSNGRVWLINPSGILVGASGRVDTAGFVASTLGVTNSDFLAGRLSFGSGEGSTAGVGNVVNQGAITTSSGGSVYLVAPNVTNQGIITTPQGETILAAGQTVQLIDTATPGVRVEITGAEGNATNLGDIVADAGRIGIAGVMVRNSGTLNASSVVSEGGRVFLKASQDAYVDGAGRIVTTGTKGGSVEVLGNRVAVMDSASIDASGTNGGGSIKVGGDYQGKNPDIQNSMTTYFGPDASLRVDATSVGAGGTVIVWSDGTTQAHGSISAQGGTSGDGGLVETSGHVLETTAVRVNAGAVNGTAGTWLLDPNDIVINHAGSNTQITGTTPFQPTQSDASVSSLSDSAINAALNGGTSVLVKTTSTFGGTSGNGDITVNSDVAIGPGAATNKPKFALNADRNISVAFGAQISGSAGRALNVEMVAGVLNSTGSISLDGNIKSFGGDVILKAAGNIVVGNSAATSSSNSTGINARVDGIGPGSAVTTADTGIGGHIRLSAGGMVTISQYGGAQTSNTGTVIGGDAGGVAISIVAGDLNILSGSALRTTYVNGGVGFGGGDIAITSATGGPIRLGTYGTTAGYLTLDNADLSQFRVSAPSACGVANGCRIWIGNNDFGVDGTTGSAIPKTTGDIFVNNANFAVASGVDAQRNVVLSTKSGNIVDQSTTGYGVRAYGLILQGEGAAYGDMTAGAPFKFSGNEFGTAMLGGANILHVSPGTLVLNAVGAPGSVANWYPADVKIVSQSGNILLVPFEGFAETPADGGIYYVGKNLTVQAPGGDVTLGGAGISYPVTSSVGSNYSISSPYSAKLIGYSTTSPHQDGGPAPGYAGTTSVNLAAMNDVKLDSGSLINAKTVTLEADRDIITQGARIGGLDSNSLAIILAADRDVTITSSAFETNGGAMSIDSGNNFTLTSTAGNGAILSTAGCALVNFQCRNQNFNFVQGGLQTVTANAGTIKIEAPVGGGFGVALLSGGGQTITANNLEIRGGLAGSGNDAWITNRSNAAGQTISAHTILLQAGGANAALATDRDNDAGIYSSAGLQTINITGTGGSLTLNGGAGGHNNAAAILSNSGGQVLNVHGAVSINGGNADGSYQNFAEVSSNADQTINIYDGGSITLNGGAGNGYGLDSFFNHVTQQYESVPNTEKSSNFARIALEYGGSPHTQVINFVNGGSLSLSGGSRGSNNYAEVNSAFGQTIDGNPDVFIRGGASGGAVRIAESVSNVQGHERSNHAGIFGGDDDNAGSTQSTFNLHSLTMEGGGNANSFGGAGLEGFNLTVNVLEDVTLTGGASNTSDIDDVPNATSAVHLTVSDSNSGSHLLTLNVGRDLNIIGGIGSSGLAFVGSGHNAAMNISVTGNINLEAEQAAASKVGIGSLFGTATGSVLVGGTANVSAKNGGIAVIGSNLGPMLGMPYPPNVTPPGVLPPLLSGGDVAITGGLAIDAGASGGSAVSLNANGKIIVSGARVGGTAAYGLGINLRAAGDILITNSALETNGADMTIDSGNNFTLTATTGGGSILSTAGCSSPSSVDCRTGPYIEGGLQTVDVAGTVKVEANASGGFGVALFSGGGQSIIADRVEVLGGVSGSNNDAYIANRSSYNQEITAHTIVVKAGGTANTDENNDAVIYSSAGAQFITVTGSVGNLGSLAIYGGAAGHGNTGGIYSASGAQNIDVVGNILVQGGGNAASYQNYAGIENNAGQTINIYYGGSVVLRGGAGGGFVSATGRSDNYASITTTSGDQTIDFDVGGRLDLFGGSVGNANYARIWNSGAGAQTITGNPDITMTGGDSGGAGAFNNDPSTDPFLSGSFAPVSGNNAMIAAGKAFDNEGAFAVDSITGLPVLDPITGLPVPFGDGIPDGPTWVKGTQSIDAASITINGSSRNVVATGLGGAGLFSAYGQTVNVVGALRLMGGNATNSILPNARSRTRLWSMGGEQVINAMQLQVIGATSGTNNIATVGSWGNQTINLSANGAQGTALFLQTNGAGATNVLNNSLDGTQTITFTGQQAKLRVEGSFATLGTNANVANTAHPDQHIAFVNGGSIEVIGVGRPIQALDGFQTPRAAIASTGDQEITGATSITLTAGNTPNGRARIFAQGDQHIETNQLSLTGGGGNAFDSYAAIEHGSKDTQGMVTGWGEQHIVLTGANAVVTLRGGDGNGVNTNSQESGNFAEIKNRVDDPNTVFDQHIEFQQTGGKISIYGGSIGSSNSAGIGSHFGQKITGNPIVLLQGGASGGAADLVNQYGGDERSNDAGIFGGDDENVDHSVSDLSFASLTINGGTGANTFSKAGVGGDDVTLTVHGNVTLTGGQSVMLDSNNDVPNSATGAFIYHDKHGSINMTVDGNLVLNGGTGTSGIALIGSGGPANVTLSVGGDLTATAGAGAVTIGSVSGLYNLLDFPGAVAYGGGTNVSVSANNITLNGGGVGSGGLIVGSGNNRILFDGCDDGCEDVGTGPVNVELVAARNLTINGQTGGVVVGTKVLGVVADSGEFDFPPPDPGSRVTLVAGAQYAEFMGFAGGGGRQLEASGYGGNITTSGAVTIRTDNFSPSAEIHLTAITSNTNTLGDVSLGVGTLLDGDVVHVNSAGDFRLDGQSTGTEEFSARAGWNGITGTQSARGGNIVITQSAGGGNAIYDVIGIELKAFAGELDATKGNITIGGALETGGVGGVGVYAARDLTLTSSITNNGIERTVHLQAGLADNESGVYGGNVTLTSSGVVNVNNGGSLHVVAVSNGTSTTGNINFNAGSTVYSSNEVLLTADSKVTLNGFVEATNLFHVSASGDIAMGASGEISSGDAELYANGNIQIDGLINASGNLEIETGAVGSNASQGNITLGESSRLYSDRVTIRAEGDLTASGWIENGENFDTYVHLSAGDGGEGASARGGNVWLKSTSSTQAYGGIYISASAGTATGLGGTVTHDGEMTSSYYADAYVTIDADRNINISGLIDNDADNYNRGIKLSAGDHNTSMYGGNVVFGAGSSLDGNASSVRVSAFGGSETAGNIIQNGGIIWGNYAKLEADGNINVSGTVGGRYFTELRAGLNRNADHGGDIVLSATSVINANVSVDSPNGGASLVAYGGISAAGNVIQNGGSIYAGKNGINVYADGNVNQYGGAKIVSTDELRIVAGRNIKIDGQLESSNYLTLFAGGDGADTTVGNIELGAASHLIHSGAEYVWAAATGDLTLNGSITSDQTIYGYAGYSASLESPSARGGNLRLGADSGIAGSSVYLKAFGGIAPSSGNISQDGGSISAHQNVEITADRDVMLNGNVGNVGTFGYANVEITAGALGYRGGSESLTSLGGNILLGSSSAITAADVDLRTYQPTGATTFSTGNISQTAGGQIDVTYVTSLHVHAAGNVELLGSVDAPYSSVEIYAGYESSCGECTNAQVFADKHITVSDLNAQSSSVTLNATGPIMATIEGANTVSASIENSSTGGISITASGANIPNLTLVDHATANRSVTYTLAEGDLVVTDGLHLDAGSSGTVGFAAHDGDLNWNATNVYGGGLSLGASGAITQSSLINVSSLTTASGGSTNLTGYGGSANAVNTYNVSNSATGQTSFNAAGDLVVGTVNSGQPVALSAGGAITQTGVITAGSLSTTSVGGTTLVMANQIGTYSGNNSGTGSISFTNGNANGLVLASASNTATAGDVSVVNAGVLNVSGNVASARNIVLNSAGAITETGSLNGLGLTTTSVGGTTLGMANQIASYTGNNSGSGNINVTSANAAGLAVAAISNTATAGDVSVTNAGVLNVNGNVATARNIVLNSAGAITAAGNLSGLELTATSVGGAAFTGANQIQTVKALNNSGSGNITMNDAANLLTVGTINNGAGNVTVNSTGAITIGGIPFVNSLVNASGTSAVAMTAQGPITVTNTGTVTADTGITLTAGAPSSALTINGTVFSGGGVVELVGGTVILDANATVRSSLGGSIEVAAIGAQGDIIHRAGGGLIAADTVTLVADRDVSLNGRILVSGEVDVVAGLNSLGSAGGNIALGASSDVRARDVVMIANRDTGTGAFTTGNVSQQAGSFLQTDKDFLINASGNIDMLGSVNKTGSSGRTNLLAGFNTTNATQQAFTGKHVTANGLRPNGGSVSIQATAGIDAVVQSAGVVGANINNSAAGGLNITSYGASALVLVDNSVANSAINLDYRNAALTLGANSALVTGNGAGKVTVNSGNLTYSGANVSANGVRFTSTGNISQTAPITTNVLYTTSYGGTALSLDNVVGTYSGINSGSGNLAFKSIKAGGLTLAGADPVAVKNLAAAGDIIITSAGSGPLTISGGVSSLGNVSFSSAGAIAALANLTAVGLNSVSVGGANYSGANHFTNVTSLTNTGSGNVVFNNTAAPLTIAKMTNTGGNITVDNFGKVVISGEMNATGTLSVTAHSPLTVASTGSVTAVGDLSLVAASSSAASTIDLLTIDGPVLSSGGNIALFGGSGIAVTKAVTSNNGNVNATSPFGDITQTPDKLITAPKGKVDLSAFGARPKDPVVIPSEIIPDPDPVKDLPRVEVITSLVTTTGSTNSNLGGDSTGGTAGTFGGTASSDEKKEEEKKDATGTKTGGEEKPAAQKAVGSCT